MALKQDIMFQSLNATRFQETSILHDQKRELDFMLKREKFLLSLYEDLINKGLPSGMYLTIEIPENNQPLQIWNGVIFIRSGFYEEGIFKFNIIFPEKFPFHLPQVQFLSKLYHPLIDFDKGFLDYSSLLKFQEQKNYSENKENCQMISNKHLSEQNTNQKQSERFRYPKMPDGFIISLTQLIWNIFYNTELCCGNQTINYQDASQDSENKTLSYFNHQAYINLKFNLPDYMRYAQASVLSSKLTLESLHYNNNYDSQINLDHTDRISQDQNRQTKSILELKVNYESQEEVKEVQQLLLKVKNQIEEHLNSGRDQDEIIQLVSAEILNEIELQALQFNFPDIYQQQL